MTRLSEPEGIDPKSDVQTFLKERGAFKVGVADPISGFEKATKGCHPLDIMKDAKSVIVFAVYVGSDYYRTVRIKGKTAADDRIGYIFRDWLAYELAEALKARGFDAIVPSGYFDKDRKIARVSYKLAAYEAGIGVYGKSGLIISPEYGPRINVGVVLASVALKPDKRLEFDPCQKCTTCAGLCPVKAVRDGIEPPLSHEREKCVSFVQALRDQTKDPKFFCGYCYDRCPVGKTRRRGFSISRYNRLADLEDDKRDKLIRKASSQGWYPKL